MLNLIPFSTRQFAGTKRSQAAKTVLYGQLSSLWPHCVANAGIIFLSCFFSSFFLFSSPNLNHRRLDVYHTGCK